MIKYGGDTMLPRKYSDCRQETLAVKAALREAGIEANVKHLPYGNQLFVIVADESTWQQAGMIVREATGRWDAYDIVMKNKIGEILR